MLINAAYDYGTQLNLNKFRGIIDIRVPRKRGYIDRCIGGYCSADRYELNDGKRHWWVTIELANLTDKDMLRNLAHEMVHAKQFLRKELTETMDKWKGIVFTASNEDNYYLESPWEREAYGMESILYTTYMEKKNGRRL